LYRDPRIAAGLRILGVIFIRFIIFEELFLCNFEHTFPSSDFNIAMSGVISISYTDAKHFIIDSSYLETDA